MPTRAPSTDAAIPERILSAADKLFYRHGLHAVGVDLIAAEAGISKRTLYNYYPSKDGLIAAYLAGRAASSSPPGAEPAQELLAFFDRLGDWFRSPSFRGCPFINAASELDDPDHPARAVARAAKERRLRWFRERLERLGVEQPQLLARQLALLTDGAATQALVRGDKSAALAAREAARALLQAAGVALEPACTKPVAKARRRAR